MSIRPRVWCTYLASMSEDQQTFHSDDPMQELATVRYGTHPSTDQNEKIYYPEKLCSVRKWS